MLAINVFTRSAAPPLVFAHSSAVSASRIESESVLLLLGDSGVGKTSLLHAGIIPEAIRLGWRPVYVRSLGLPASDVTHQLQSSLFKGRPGYHGLLLPFVVEVLTVLPEKRLLVIIDQFEDVLVSRSPEEVEKLIGDLKLVHQFPDTRLRILISYRSDLEGRLGQFWQAVSGSAAGLARVYLSGLSANDTADGVAKTARGLGVSLNIDPTEWKIITGDLEIASAALRLTGIYPPHIQMLIEHIWNSTDRGRTLYSLPSYRQARGVDGIVGDYLGRQLKYAEDQKGNIRQVLVALVRSYGVKAQKRLDELTSETGLDETEVELAIEKLIDLRLVRHIEQYYEITHDFIARKVLSELVDSEEKEFKRFHELLRSKSAAFVTTGALLSNQEMLLLYKHRERIVTNEEEVHLLLVSWLSGAGPALHWLLNPEWKNHVRNWLASELTKEGMGREDRAAGAILRLALDQGCLTEEVFLALKGYKHAIELASLIKKDAALVSDEIVLHGLKHARGEVRQISQVIIAQRLGLGQWSLVTLLAKSSSPHLRAAYYNCLTDVDIPVAPANEVRVVEVFRTLQLMQRAPREEEATAVWSRLKRMRVGRDTMRFGWGLLKVRARQFEALARAIRSHSSCETEMICRALGGSLHRECFQSLLGMYEEWNARERDEKTTPAACRKADAIAQAVSHTTTPEFSPTLGPSVGRIRLTSSSRSLILALLSHGSANDVDLVVERIANHPSPIVFRNHTELGLAVARRMLVVQSGVPGFLLNILNKREFWEYDQQRNFGPPQSLGLKTADNRSLYVRIAAYAAIGAAGSTDLEVLLRLATHSYGLVARAAAIRLVRLSRAAAFKQLIDAMSSGRSEREARSFAETLRDAEIEHYRVADVW